MPGPPGRRTSPRGVTQRERQRMRDEYDAGVTLQAIAEAHDMAPSTVYHHVHVSRGGSGRVVPEHGTQLGWLGHDRDGQPPCPPCHAAHWAWTAGLALMNQETARA